MTEATTTAQSDGRTEDSDEYRQDIVNAMASARASGIDGVTAAIMLIIAAGMVVFGVTTMNGNPLFWITVALLGVACWCAGDCAKKNDQAANAYFMRATGRR